jgi:protein CpxP
MKTHRHRVAAALTATVFAACFAPGFAGAALAADAADAADAPPAAAHGGPQGFGGHGPGMPGPDMPPDDMHGMHGGLMGHLHGLGLSEAQQDKLFAIHHAAEPEQREHMKAIRKAHEALAELAHAERFDDARATALSRDLGAALGAEALLQARTEAQALAVLTPEQREQLRRRRMPGPQMRPGAQGGQGAPQDLQAPPRR